MRRFPRLAGMGLVLAALTLPDALAQSAVLDISGLFNWDTIIDDASEIASATEGFRTENKQEYFATEAGSVSILGGDGIDGDGSDLPASGLLDWGVHTFQMGPLGGASANTILLDNDGGNTAPNMIEMDIVDASFTQIAVLHSAVALGTTDNGTVTIHYTTGDPDEYEWDNADWNAAAAKTKFGMSTPVVGDLLGNSSAADGLDFFRGASGQIIDTSGGRLYGQAFAADPGRVIDRIAFALPETAGGDTGIYALSGSDQPLPPPLAGVSVDISAYFNQDTIINAPGDDGSQGYRPGAKSEYFATEAGSASIGGGDGVDGDGTDIPNDGLLTSGPFEFAFGPMTGGEANTILLDNDGNELVHPSSIEMDIEDASFDHFAVLYSGLAVISGHNGKFVVHYTDGSQAEYDWDLADWSGAALEGLAESALGPGVDFYRNTSGGIINTASGNLFTQNFNLDESKTVDKVAFMLNANVSASSDVGIYAVSGANPIPEPGTLVMLVGAVLLWVWRER